MTRSFLKATSSLCVGLMLLQPLAGYAQTGVTGADGAACADGRTTCPPLVRGRTDKAPKGRPKPDETIPGPAIPAPESTRKAKPLPAPNPPSGSALPLAAVTPEGQRQPKAQTAPDPGPFVRAPAPPPAAPPPSAPDATSLVPDATPDTRAPGRNAHGPQARPVAAADAPRDAEIVPTAPPVRLLPHDVRRSDQNWPDRRGAETNRNGSGLTDLEKFGLIALGAVVVGAILSNGRTVVSNSGDRVIVRDRNGDYDVMHDDGALVRRPGSTVTTQRYADGSLLSRVVRPDGTVVLTVLDADGRVLRRTVQRPDHRAVVLYDDTRREHDFDPARLPSRPALIIDYTGRTDRASLRRDFAVMPPQDYSHMFSLRQVRETSGIRYLVPQADLGALTFATGSAALTADQAQTLGALGGAMSDLIAADPSEVFLIEGHTDAVGDIASNLALSDARAESVALALTEYFGVPPENLVTQGYGESDLKVQTEGPEQANRRVVVRRITWLLSPVAAN